MSTARGGCHALSTARGEMSYAVENKGGGCHAPSTIPFSASQTGVPSQRQIRFSFSNTDADRATIPQQAASPPASSPSLITSARPMMSATRTVDETKNSSPCDLSSASM